jgi:D-alanyl-D-alanine carboxypeptidase (penicillin-binding protein 5/6)
MRPRTVFALGFGLLVILPLTAFVPGPAPVAAPVAASAPGRPAAAQPAAAPVVRVRESNGLSNDKPMLGQPAPPAMAHSVVGREAQQALNGLAPPKLMGGSLAPPKVGARHYVVLDDASGKVLFERDGNLRVPPASLTKIATAIVVLEQVADLKQAVTTTVDGRKMGDSSVMGIYPVDLLTVEDLLHGLMLPSGNDAAIELARVVAGDEAKFVGLMNDLVDRLGLKNTHFTNPHGLDDVRHYSSAYDLAVLARHGMGDATFRKIVGTPRYVAKGFKTYPMSNTNPLLGKYGGADGVKTGLTDNAGRTFVASASRGGNRVFVSFVMSKDRAADAVSLLDYAFAMYRWPSASFAPVGPLP